MWENVAEVGEAGNPALAAAGAGLEGKCDGMSVLELEDS